MSSPPAQQAEWQFRDLQAADLDAIMAIELACYEFPWSRGNFADSIAEGYRCQGLFMAGQLLGYSIAMRGVDEAHLLNIAVAPACQGQKLAVVLLHQLCAWARLQPLDWLWLEVRLSNVRAQKLYRDYGMHTVGQRKNYYQTATGHEDALMMSYALAPPF
jgi:ribosomal-protein-alanine N-acetyltransferase